MTVPLKEHLDTAIEDLQNMRNALSDSTLKEKLSKKDRNKFLQIFLSKAKQQILMMELYFK